MDFLFLELQRAVDPHQETQRRLSRVVVERAGVAALLVDRPDAVRVTAPQLRIELDAVVPAAGAQLAADQSQGGIARRLQADLVPRQLVGRQIRAAHGRSPWRLDPDGRRAGLAFAFAPRQVFAVTPQVTSADGDLRAKELDGTPQRRTGFRLAQRLSRPGTPVGTSSAPPASRSAAHAQASSNVLT